MKRTMAITVSLVALMVIGISSAGADWHTFVIRNSTTSGSPPAINDNTSYGMPAKEFVIAEGGQKAAWGTSALDGKKMSDIAQLLVTRLDDRTRFTAGSGPYCAPYFNIWVTDGAGKYAVIGNEPSDPAFQLLYSNGYDLTWADIADKRAKAYENSDKTWLPKGGVGMTFADLADFVVQAPTGAELTTGWAGLSTGAPRELGTNVAYGFNWVFGDTLSNYVSGDLGYVVANPVANPFVTANYLVSPGSLAAGKPEFSPPHGTGTNPFGYDWDSTAPGTAAGAPTGYGASSFYASVAQSGATQPDRYRTLRIGMTTLFGSSVTLSQVAKVSYYTNKPADQTGIDWRVSIYTTWDPAGGNMSSWYRNRIQSHTAAALNLNAPAATWNLWSTAVGTNQLQFYTSRSGFTAENIAFSELTAGPVTRGSSTWDFSGEEIMMIDVCLGANSGGGTGESQVDGVRIELTSGQIANVDLTAGTTWKVATVHGADQFTIGADATSLTYHQQPRDTKGWYWYNNNGSPPGTLATGGYQTPNGYRDGSRTFACTDVAVGKKLNELKLVFDYKNSLGGYTTINFFMTDGAGKFGIFAPTSAGLGAVAQTEVVDADWNRMTIDLTRTDIPDTASVAVFEHNGFVDEYGDPFTAMTWGDIKNYTIAGMYDYQRGPAHGWDHWGTMFAPINTAGNPAVVNGCGLALIWGDTVGNTTYATQQRQIRNVQVSFAGVDYIGTFADAQISDVLELNVSPDSLYIKPGESIIVDMNVSNLAQKVNACQALLGYNSDFFNVGAVAAGGGVWDLLIYETWAISGEINTAIGVDAQGSVGTDADGKVATVTMTAKTQEGTTQMVFLPDVNDVKGTFLSDMSANPVWPSKIDSQTIVVDGTLPVVTVLAPNGGDYLKGGQSYDITWTATDTYIAPNSILIEYFDGTTWQTLATDEANDGTYTWNPVPSLDISSAKVRVSASDLAGNVGADESDAAFTIDSTPPSINIASAKQALTEGPFNAPGFTYKKLIDGGTHGARSASFSPDGSKVVYIDRFSGVDTMTLYDRASSSSIALASGPAAVTFTTPYFSADGSKIGWSRVNATTANDLEVYDVIAGTITTYLHPVTGTADALNSDFLGTYTDRWTAWDRDPATSWAELFLYGASGANWQQGTNLTNSAALKEYEPDSNRAGNKILFWSGETTTEPIDTAHILVWNGSTWAKDTGFAPIVGCTWAFWSYDETEIGVTKFDSSPGSGKGDLYVYDSAGNFKFDLTGAAVGQGSYWQFFGFNCAAGPSGTGREYLFTSEAGNTQGGRDIWVARRTPELLYSLTSVPREAATQGRVYIQVTASDVLAGLAAPPAVTVTDSASAPMPVTSVGEGPTGTFTYYVTVAASTPDGKATVNVTVSDRSGNSASDTDYFDIYKDQVTGTVSFATLSSTAYSFNRDVVFVATDGSGTVLKTWTITVAFANASGTASGSYTLTNVPAGTANLSAKTAWHLRKKQAALFDGNGQAVSAFTLLGGDVNGSNTVNILDYSLTKVNWYTSNAVADINGDGQVQGLDYSLMKSNWFQVGDPE